MSLLMEALRKAEGQGESPAPPDPTPRPLEDELPDSLLTLDLPEASPEAPTEPVAFEPLDAQEETAAAEAQVPEDETEPTETEPEPIPQPVPPEARSDEQPVAEPAAPAPDPTPQPQVEPLGQETAEPPPLPEGDPRLAKALLEAGRKPRVHRRRMLLLLVAGLVLVVGLVAWYYLVLVPEGQALHPSMVSTGGVSAPPLQPAVNAQPERAPAQASKAADEGASVAPAPEKNRISATASDGGQTPPKVATSQPARHLAGTAPPKAKSKAKPKVQAGAPTARQIYQQALARQTKTRRPIKIRRSRPARGGQQLREAWRAYQAGDYPRAERLYRQVLEKHPLNRDALLGLAALAVVNRRPDHARDHYLRLLERDPSDPLAVAGLVSVAGGGDPVAAVSRVRSLIAEHPDLAPLKFVLGNLYAAQGRWNYAQQAYFEAVAADGDHPDYLYNLAVSLDHLGKGREAVRYYRRALDAAGRRPAGFDAQAVRSRLAALAGGEGS